MGHINQLLPKGMLPCGDSSLIIHLLRTLTDNGFLEVSVGLGWLGNKLENHLREWDEKAIRTVYVENYNIGPLQTLVSTAECLDNNWFIICPVDNLIDINIINSLVEAIHLDDAIAYLAVDSRPNVGAPVVIDDQGCIESIGKGQDVTNPHGSSAMVLVINNSFLEECKIALRKGISRIVDVLNDVILQGERVKPIIINDYWTDIDSLHDLIEANRYLIDTRYARDWSLLIPEGDQIEFGETIVFEGGTIIQSGVNLIGPVLVKKGVKIHQEACLGPNVSVLSGSIISEQCKISEAIVVGETRLAKGVSLSNVVVYDGIVYGSSDDSVSK